MSTTTNVLHVVGSVEARLLYASQEVWASPASVADVISLGDVLPRDPWQDLAAGSRPRMLRSRRSIFAEFVVAVSDADHSDWAGYSLPEVFSLAVIQKIDQDLVASSAQVKFTRSELAAENNVWVGKLQLEVVRARQLSPVAIRS